MARKYILREMMLLEEAVEEINLENTKGLLGMPFREMRHAYNCGALPVNASGIGRCCLPVGITVCCCLQALIPEQNDSFKKWKCPADEYNGAKMVSIKRRRL